MRGGTSVFRAGVAKEDHRREADFSTLSNARRLKINDEARAPARDSKIGLLSDSERMTFLLCLLRVGLCPVEARALSRRGHEGIV